MGIVTAKHLKQKTGEIIKRVKAGESLIITHRGKPVAIMEPPANNENKGSQKLRPFDEAWADIEKGISRTDINRRASKTLIQIVISAFQDVMKRSLRPIENAVNFDQKESIEKLALRFDPEQSARMISDCYKMVQWIDSSVNEKLIFEDLLLNLAGSDIIKV